MLIQIKDTNAANQVNDVVNDILKAGCSEYVTVHLCFWTTKNFIPLIDFSIPSAYLDPLSDEESLGFFYKLIKSPDSGQPALHLLEPPLRGFFLTDRIHLGNYLEKIVGETASERKLLITWGEGNFLHLFKGSFDGSFLKADDLQFALQQAKTHWDLAILMNCSTNNVNFITNLVDFADYFIAPQVLVFGAGYNFNLLFKTIGEEPEINSKKLAGILVGGQGEIDPERKGQDQNLKELTLIGIKLIHIKAALSKLDSFLESFIPMVDSDENLRNAIIDRMEKIRPVDESGKGGLKLLDFRTVMRILRTGNANLNTEITEVEDLVLRGIVRSFLGEEIRDGMKKAGLPDPTFITYFFKNKNTILESSDFKEFVLVDGPSAMTYSKTSKWVDLINSVFV